MHISVSMQTIKKIIYNNLKSVKKNKNKDRDRNKIINRRG